MKEFSFQIAAGSIPGRDHIGRNGLLLGKNNQDAFAFSNKEHFIAAVVCDGCGASSHSEVGSKIGARLVIAALERRMSALERPCGPDTARLWESVRRDVLAEIHVLARELAGNGSFTETISDYFLFTTLVLLVTPDFTEVVGIGDGVFALNGEITELPSEPGNKPIYAAYDLIASDLSATPERLRFQQHGRIATSEMKSALIGTDGVSHLIANPFRPLPGRSEAIGKLAQFWTEDRYFKNPDAMRRRLALINSEVMMLDRNHKTFHTETGPLADDTTFVVVRRG